MSSPKSPTFTYPMSYPLNRQNVKKFIAASAPDARDAVRKFIKATTHISFETFIRYVNKNLRDVVKLVPPGRPMFVYINEFHKEKSSYWLYLYVKKMAKTQFNIDMKMIDNYNNNSLQHNDILLILDDCAYSGGQISTILAELDTNDKQLHIIIFVPFISDAAIELIRDIATHNSDVVKCKISFLKNAYKIKPLRDYMNVSEFYTILKYYITSTRAAEEIQKYPIYFDHKLADHVSSFPYLYNGNVPSERNLETAILINNKYKRIAWLHSKGLFNVKYLRQEIAALENQYQSFPLFSDDKNLFPRPPYYRGYTNAIKQGLRNIVTKTQSNTSKRTNVVSSRKSLSVGSKISWKSSSFSKTHRTA
jgi:hypothetical protein